jgi:hypothetical protein
LKSFVICESKAVPLHTMEAIVREMRQSSYSFLTSVLDGHRGQGKSALHLPGIEPSRPVCSQTLNSLSFIHKLYSSLNIIRQIKSRSMRWTQHMAHMGESRQVYKVWWESPKEREYSEDRGVVGRMGSEWILGSLVVGGSGFNSLRTGTSGRLLYMQ